MIIELVSLGRTAEALRTKIDRKSAISLQRGHYDAKFQVKRDVPLIFAWIVRPMTPYNFAADICTQRNFVADFLQGKCDFRGFFGPFGGLMGDV